MNLLQLMRKRARNENENQNEEAVRGFRQVNYDEAMEIRVLYSRGHSMVEIGKILRRSPATVQRVLKKTPPEVMKVVEEKRAQAKQNGQYCGGDKGHFRAGRPIGHGTAPEREVSLRLR